MQKYSENLTGYIHPASTGSARFLTGDAAPKVVIVGGGLAGLTAAKTLVDAGARVELLEQRPVLGGKISAWKDHDGDWIESGLHVFFGAYQEIFDLMRELGVYHHILWKEHVLTYTLADGERFAFDTWKLPAPLHLIPAIVGNRYFTLKEKLLLAKAMPQMVYSKPDYYARQDSLTYTQWHTRAGISDRMLEKMFLPMSLALKFLPPKEISAKIVLDVSGIFLREDKASMMGFIDGSPQEKLTGPLATYIEQRGGVLRLNMPVRKLHLAQAGDDPVIAGVESESGEVIKGDYYIFALPIHKLNRLIPDWLKRSYPYFGGLSKIDGVPVMTAQLWYDRQVSGIDNILFGPDGIIPVYADLANTTPDYACDGRSRIEAVVAPARDLWEKSDDEVLDQVEANIRSYFPQTARDAKVIKRTLVRIPQSVYAPLPGSEAYRVPQTSPLPNLFLAGGYTKQKFYDSMEGAVSSGRRAAHALLASAMRK